MLVYINYFAQCEQKPPFVDYNTVIFTNNPHYRLHSLLLVMALGLFLRLYQLGNVPPGMSHDELDFINHGYSLSRTGKDLYGDALPLTLGRGGHVSLPAYLVAPAVFFGLSSSSARILPAVLGTIEIALVYAISLVLFRNHWAALGAALLLATSAWGIKISRVMFDPPVSLFFFLSGITVYLLAVKPKQLILSFIFVSLGFLSYYGAIFFFPGVISVMLWYRWQQIKAWRLLPLIFLVVGLSLVVFFRGVANSPATGRSRELVFSSDSISATVIFDRFHALTPAWINRIFINKGTVLFHRLAVGYLDSFSPQMIFVSGDPNRNYGLWGRGELNLIDLPFVLIGVFTAFVFVPVAAALLSLLILIAPLTTTASSPVYATRAFLLWPFLFIFAGLGLAAFFRVLLPRFPLLLRRLLPGLIIAVYLYSVSGTIHQYFYRYPVYASEIWFDSERQLSYFLKSNSAPVTVYSPEAKQIFMEYFFYAQPPLASVHSALASATPQSVMTLPRLIFFPGCPDQLLPGQIISHLCSFDRSLAQPLIYTSDKSNRVIWYATESL